MYPKLTDSSGDVGVGDAVLVLRQFPMLYVRNIKYFRQHASAGSNELTKCISSSVRHMKYVRIVCITSMSLIYDLHLTHLPILHLNIIKKKLISVSVGFIKLQSLFVFRSKAKGVLCL